MSKIIKYHIIYVSRVPLKELNVSMLIFYYQILPCILIFITSNAIPKYDISNL